LSPRKLILVDTFREYLLLAYLREGSEADLEGVPVYSFNYVTADALFDEIGKILK
jgi:hypothetical protein